MTIKSDAVPETPQVADAKDREALDQIELATQHLNAALAVCRDRGIRVEWGTLSAASDGRDVPKKVEAKFVELWSGEFGVAFRATKRFVFKSVPKLDPEVHEREW